MLAAGLFKHRQELWRDEGGYLISSGLFSSLQAIEQGGRNFRGYDLLQNLFQAARKLVRQVTVRIKAADGRAGNIPLLVQNHDGRELINA